MSDNPQSTDGVTLHRRHLGPHRVPRIECGRCGTEHHFDAANGEFLGRCRECSAFLRRPTDAERKQFTDFLVWNMLHRERRDEDGHTEKRGEKP
jgi:hypothetical protein